MPEPSAPAEQPAPKDPAEPLAPQTSAPQKPTEVPREQESSAAAQQVSEQAPAPSVPAEPQPTGAEPEQTSAQPKAAAAAQGPSAPPAPAPAERAPEGGNTLIVRYGIMKHIGEFRHDLPLAPPPGAKVVVRTDRGVELGEVVIGIQDELVPHCITRGQLARFLEASAPEYSLLRGGRVLRRANPQDVIDHRHLETSAKEEGAYCRQQIRDLGMSMRLVTVEHLLGGERIIFYFSSETRVDFRELVRRMAGQFRTRIEMRQVGARDEARLVADYERCGQRCCCQQYLKDLKPVSMRMAKTQKATLDPSKISGRCGRLMCCLRYEDATYEELRARLPRKNTWVRSKEGIGKVIDTQILTQLVRLLQQDNSQIVVANEEIIDRDAAPPPLPAPKEQEAAEAPPARAVPRMLRDEAPSKPAEPPAEPLPVTAGAAAQMGEDSAPEEAPGDGPAEGEAAIAAQEAEPGAVPAEGEIRRGELASSVGTSDLPGRIAGAAAPGAPAGGQRPPSQPGQGGQFGGPEGRRRRRRRGRHGQQGGGQPQGGAHQGGQGALPRAAAPGDRPASAQPQPPGQPAPSGQAPQHGQHFRGRRRRRRHGHPGQGGPNVTPQ